MAHPQHPIQYGEGPDLEPDLCHTCESSMDEAEYHEWICSNGCGEIISWDIVDDCWKVVKKGELDESEGDK